MSTWAIGDVHGCVRTLDALVAQLPPDATLVFLGDYVDRGPDSPGTLDRLIALDRERACVFLRGNHDQMLLDAADEWMTPDDLALWTKHNGGGATLAQYAQRGGVPDEHVAFLRATRLFYDTPDAVYVHAGLNPFASVAVQLADPDPFTMLWTRRHLDVLPAERRWEKTVVCGHTPHREPIDQSNLVLIDTGAFRPSVDGFGRLTAVEMPTRRFVSVLYSD